MSKPRPARDWACCRAVELDPVSLSVRADLGWYHLVAGQWEHALAECARALELQPGYGFALGCRERAFRRLGEFESAVEVAAERLQRAGAGEEEIEDLTAGEPAAALERIERKRLERLQAWVQEREAVGERGDPLGLAWRHAAVGELDAAFRWLERAVEAGEPWLVFLWVDPRFEPLWSDARFGGVAERVGIGQPDGVGVRMPS